MDDRGRIAALARMRPARVAAHYTFLASPNLVFGGTGGTAGGTYYVLASTNVTARMTNWVRVATNAFGTGGTFSVTNALDPARPHQFFRLQLP